MTKDDDHAALTRVAKVIFILASIKNLGFNPQQYVDAINTSLQLKGQVLVDWISYAYSSLQSQTSRSTINIEFGVTSSNESKTTLSLNKIKI